jgi:hypothetical protein
VSRILQKTQKVAPLSSAADEGVSTLFMIDDISVSINFSGDKFSPTKAENVTGLIFSDKIEYGDIGIRGKYKGIAVPYGSGTLKVSKDIDMNDRILWLTEALSGKIETLRTLGSDEPHIYIGYKEINRTPTLN